MTPRARRGEPPKRGASPAAKPGGAKPSGSPAKAARATRRSAGGFPAALRSLSWELAIPLGGLLVLLKAVGAPFGEPVADDFDFLHRVVLQHDWNLLDGGGSALFWRPLAHQLYYIALGPVMLAAPRAIGAIHLVLLVLTCWLATRAARGFTSAPVAVAIGSTPLLMEISRNLITWPSHFVELGLLLFSAAALHEATRRRLATALAATAAALFCKEMAVITAAFVAVAGAASEPESRGRRRWAVGLGTLVVLWAIAYRLVMRRAGLSPGGPMVAGEGPLGRALAWLSHTPWAAVGSARAAFSVADGATRAWTVVLVCVLGLLALAAVKFRSDPGARYRLRAALPLAGVGAAWFAAGVVIIAGTFPVAAPHRAVFPALGLMAVLVPVLYAARPSLAGALILLRLVTMLLAPSAPRAITTTREGDKAFLDFPQIVRLQRLMTDLRTTLQHGFPAPPHGARIGRRSFPEAAIYALSGDKSLQVWYRDTTLTWVLYEDLTSRPETPFVVLAEFEPNAPRQAALVSPEAVRTHLSAMKEVGRKDFAAALVLFARADSLQRYPGALYSESVNAYNRAFCLMELGRPDEAIVELKRAIATGQMNAQARYFLAAVYSDAARNDEALEQLDLLLREEPDNKPALELRRQLSGER